MKKRHYKLTLLERKESVLKKLVDAEAFEEYPDEPVELPEYVPPERPKMSAGIKNFINSLKL